MKALLKKELRSYLYSVTGALFIAVNLLFLGIYFTAYNLTGGYPTVNFTVNARPQRMINVDACDSYTWTGGTGQTYTQSGQHSFVKPNPSSAGKRAAQYITFNNVTSLPGDNDPMEGDLYGGLLFGTRRHTIIVTSSLNREADVRIVNTAGQTIDAYTIQPGETIETRVNNSGVYIIHAAGGHYTKKVTVK